MKRVAPKNSIYYCAYYRGIASITAKRYIVGTEKHAYAYVMLTNHVANSNYMA